MKRIITPMLIIIVLLFSTVPAFSDQNPKGDEFIIAEGKINQFNPTIWGKKVCWFQNRAGYLWGYSLMLKDLNTGVTSTISKSENLLPFTNDTNRLSLNDKYCWWTAYNINNFSRYRVIVYDISQKKETVFGNDSSQMANPAMSGDDLIYTRKTITTVPSFEIWIKNMNSKKLPKMIHKYDLKANNYSFPTVDNGYAVWVDQGDIFLYDINKDSTKRITQTSEPEYYPVIQNGIIYFNRLSYLNGKLVYTINAYRIKEEVFFKVNIKEGFHWQRPSFNPNADNFIFTQQYTDSSGTNVFSLCLYDPKNDMVKEIQRFASFPVVNSQCSAKNHVVWIDNSSGSYQLKCYNYKTNETFIITNSAYSQTLPKIDGNTIVWIDSRNKNQDIYGFNIKEK